MPIFRFNNALFEQKKRIKSKKQELAQIKKEIDAANNQAERSEHKKRKQRTQQEIFQLERELRAAKEQRAASEPGTGALPDFLIIGAMKAGTTFLYNLLTRHPLVEPAAFKELHYFDHLIDEEDIEWYRRCFPQPRWLDGRRTITGEATPSYLSHPATPERVAQVVPEARLIALLRDPVDRAYSHYQQVARKGREPLTFEEAIGAKKGRLPHEEGEPSGYEDLGLDNRCGYLTRSIYVDQLLRWSRFFSDEQMLVLKSEDFYERTPEILKLVLDFLDLPEWEPKAWQEIPKKRNKGDSYEQKMHPATMWRLE